MERTRCGVVKYKDVEKRQKICETPTELPLNFDVWLDVLACIPPLECKGFALACKDGCDLYYSSLRYNYHVLSPEQPTITDAIAGGVQSLEWACRNNKLELVRVMLDHGAGVHAWYD